MPDDRTLDTVEFETTESVTSSVIWLHGLGADGHDFEPIVPELALPGAGIRFVFPHAPVRPVTLNMGMAMRAWYDIASLDRSVPQDEAGIRDSAERVEALLAREAERGVPASRTVLAGFSQGGAIALHAGLRFEARLAGIVALSCWMPLADRLAAEAAAANADTPCFVGHGTEDPMVPVEFGRRTRDLLLERRQPVEWHEYPMPHAVCPAEVSDLRAWFARVFDAAPA